MRSFFILLFICFTTLSPLYGSESVAASESGSDLTRLSIDFGLGGHSERDIGTRFGAAFDLIDESMINYRFVFAVENGGDLNLCFHGECEDERSDYTSVMLYGGASINGFTKYTGYMISLNLGVGSGNGGGKVGVMAEARLYLGPLYLFATAGGSTAQDGYGVIGLGLSTF